MRGEVVELERDRIFPKRARFPAQYRHWWLRLAASINRVGRGSATIAIENGQGGHFSLPKRDWAAVRSAVL